MLFLSTADLSTADLSYYNSLLSVICMPTCLLPTYLLSPLCCLSTADLSSADHRIFRMSVYFDLSTADLSNNYLLCLTYPITICFANLSTAFAVSVYCRPVYPRRVILQLFAVCLLPTCLPPTCLPSCFLIHFICF